MDDILTEGADPIDRSLPLEVTFTGEHAHDFGGPRRKFFSSMMRLIKENLCIENKEGYSLFQALFTEESEKTQIEEQFVQGIATFGLIKTAVSSITYPRLVKILKPTFNEQGSNRRIQEEMAYRYLLLAGGGVAVYINNNLHFDQLKNLESNDDNVCQVKFSKLSKVLHVVDAVIFLADIQLEDMFTVFNCSVNRL
ncbi:G2 M phase-specific E3 ubiquitin- ligase [Paramuricea clavata]|uniref:G2 M phase-specific E3 ubiquitin- ligase n=1 Tax=Paramuricea clavata TaxID=317549 RepID=A0A6S7GV49_PARCT|nr:G2 M phase-specific E3 ubiquitin- ligase [Paramuricea clavata]